MSKTILLVKSVYTILFISLFFSCSIAQPIEQFSTKNKKAQKLFLKAKSIPNSELDEYGRPNYIEAIKVLNQAIAKDDNFIEAYLMKGEFAEYTAQYKMALSCYEKAIAINPLHSPSAATYFYAGNMAILIGEYKKAFEYSTEYIKSKNPNPLMEKKARENIRNSNFAISQIKNKKELNPINLGKGVNTKYPEYFPTLTVDQNRLLFTRRIPDNRIIEKEQEDFYESILDTTSNKWTHAIAMPSNINTIVNEGAPTFAPDGRTIVFVGCPQRDGRTYGKNRYGKGSCDLFITKKTGNKWSNPINLPGNVNSIHWESQPSLSADGKTLYFIRGIIKRNRSGSTSRHGDIYVSKINSNGSWGSPQKLPSNINTNLDESSVLIHPDGKTLYFASNGHIGMGGHDLFMTQKNENGSWSNPVNLGYPINTHHNENSLLVSADGEIAYFASDRPGGFGDLDLYYFLMPNNIKPTKTIYLDGYVYDELTNKKLKANFKLIDLETGSEIVNSTSDPINGSFVVSLPINKNYALYAEKEGYLMNSKSFKLTIPDNIKENYHIKLPLTPIQKMGAHFVLENVFFDLNKSSLRPESFIELNRLIHFLEKNPSITIEIGGHTDTRGEKETNKILSHNRAKSVYNFLINKGIDNFRLKYKGYGEEKNVVSIQEINALSSKKEKEKAHQKNRRTEVTILSKNSQ